MSEKHDYSPFLPDWQLIPIAKYADDNEYNACVSLFGPKPTLSKYDIIYHKAFKNTLLGLRLFQMDILLKDLDSFWDIPQLGGQVILGTGEVRATEPDNSPSG